MQQLLDIIQEWIFQAGALGVFGASLLEELVSVIPSSMVQVGSGLILMQGYQFNGLSMVRLISIIVIPAALGVMIGSLPYVWVARTYGLQVVNRWGKWIGVSCYDIEKLKNTFEQSKWDDVIFVALRAFPLVPSVALALYGGLLRMSWIRYAILTTIGVCIRATVLAIVGWLFANAAGSIGQYTDILEYIGIIAIVVFIGYMLWKKNKQKPL